MSRPRADANSKAGITKILNRIGIIDLQPIDRTISPPSLEPLTENILLEAIQHYRSLDFDYQGEKNGKKVLIKINKEPLDPIHPHEARIQALRYMRGALLIINNSTSMSENEKSEVRWQINKAYNDLYNNKDPHTFINTLSIILMNNFKLASLKEASNDLSKAKNLGELLEEHPDIITCSDSTSNSNQKMLTLELASLLKINKDFYNEEINNYSDKEWFKNAGFRIPGWAENIFTHQIERIRELGVPAPSSARWLPLPSNAQQITTIQIDPNNIGQIQSSSSWCRIGTIGLSNTSDKNKSKQAESQLATIINLTRDNGVEQFKELYNGLYDPNNFTVYLSYQTLLSPIKGEHNLNHTDNNGKFVAITTSVMDKMNAANSNSTKPRIVYQHTNTAINKIADITKFGIGIIKKSKDLEKILSSKLDATENILRAVYSDYKNLPDDIKNDPEKFAATIITGRDMMSPQLTNEIYLRAYAFCCLKKLLNNAAPYSNLPNYQKNLMQAALEFHLMGSQAITLAGCKSARDRTAIFGAAVKVMQENPTAMQDWNTLNTGIIKSLNQGHHFRAISFHCAVAKVGAVHKDYFNQLSQSTREKIKNWGQFTKKHTHEKSPIPLTIQEPDTNAPLTETRVDAKQPATSSSGFFASTKHNSSQPRTSPIIGNRVRR